MKFNIICTKFDQKIKNPNFGLLRFLGIFKKPKKPRFFRSHFPALRKTHAPTNMHENRQQYLHLIMTD